VAFSGGFDHSCRATEQRFFDLTAACALLPVAWPFMFVGAGMRPVTRPDPVLQTRIGEADTVSS
jgi:lipopolysaccharide/colanic/teichoic acid biosynthesis glycosyltransferase